MIITQKHFGYKSKKQFQIFLFCWIAYFSTYVCRLNFSAVMPELTGNHVYSDSRIAGVSSAFFICYGVGQFISGLIGDRLNTRRMIFAGMLISALCNIGIFCAHPYVLLLILWGINGAAQSLVWSPILKIASVNFDAPTRSKFGIDIATTVPIGTLLSYCISLLTLFFLPWHYVFLTCGLFEVGAAAVWIFGTKNLFIEKAGQPVQQADSKDAADKLPAAATRAVGFRETARLMTTSGALLLILPIVIQGTLKDSVTQWVPTFFASTFGSGTAFALALTMLLPIVNVTGAWFAKALNKRLHNEVSTAMVFFAVAGVLLVFLRFFGDKSVVFSLIAMAAVTNCMFAVNVMFITMVPLHFAKSGRVSTIGGFLNAVAYIGCGGLNLVAGKLLEMENGWSNLFWMWIVIAGIAVVISLICTPMWKRFLAQESKD